MLRRKLTFIIVALFGLCILLPPVERYLAAEAVLEQGADIPGEEERDHAKQTFEEAWKEAAAKFKRSVELESSLHYYDQKADAAAEILSNARRRKEEVRAGMESARENIEALRRQLDTLHGAHKKRLSRIDAEREALSEYVRIVAGQDIADTDAGVIVGNPIVDALAGDSLGVTVERSLYHDALVDTRAAMFARLIDLERESGRAISALQTIALTLGVELLSLQEKSDGLDGVIAEAGDVFQEQVRARDLTETQLASIRATVAEVNARVMDAQRSLARINSALQAKAREEYASRHSAALETRRGLIKEQETLIARRRELMALKTAAQEAYEAMKSETNVERRAQQRIEETRAEVRILQQHIKEIDAGLAVELAPDAPREAHVERDRMTAERNSAEKQITAVKEKISFMEQGYNAERVDEYLRRRNKSQRADAEINAIDEDLDRIASELGTAEAFIATIEEQHVADEAGKDVFTVFTWPVYGPVTAGFFDVSYEKFFGVPHRGIDISAAQGSPVYAISEGVVLTARNGGATGYSYVLIGHRGGYTSLYGHLSKIYVSPGDVLEHGQVIGLSGGKPGTPGAGLMTTGPHVHLEIHRNGQYLNPFQVLTTGGS